MFAVRIPALVLLFILAGLLLSPAQAHNARGLSTAPIVSRQDDRREPAKHSLEVTGASSSTQHSRMTMMVRERSFPRASDPARDAALRRTDGDGVRLGESDLEALHERSPGSLGTPAAHEGQHQQRSAPAATSAAPKVLGVNIYVIIAWLALLYLMYRTGSMF